MSIPELAHRFIAAADELDATLPDILIRGANDAVALIQERIQTTGTNADGRPHKPYSESYLRFKQNPGRYKAGRSKGLASSRFTGVVDYTLTTEMFSDMKVVSEFFTDNLYRISIGVTKEVNKDKLESLGKRDGKVIRLSKSETQRVTENIEQEISEIVTRNLSL